MILHITFRDHSNPWIAYGDREKIRAAWKRWRNNPDAIPEIIHNFWRISLQNSRDRWSVYNTRTGKYKYFYRLGNALIYIEKMEDPNNENLR